jgi:hypothetical protein
LSKGILKKPRSVSESENSFSTLSEHSKDNSSQQNRHSFSGLCRNSRSDSSTNSDCNNNSHNNNNTNNSTEDGLFSSKKCVSFNKQVVRNIFKPGSTVSGMKKPNPKKNNKKNKRKRTVSDPCHDVNDSESTNEMGGANNRNGQLQLRSRSVSDSSEDTSRILQAKQSDNSSKPSVVATSISERKEDFPKDSNNNEINSTSDDTNEQKKVSKRKKKSNGCKKNQKGTDGVDTNHYTVETMLEWKNSGRLPLEDDPNSSNKTKCAFNFKNKIINDLDD